MTFVPCLDAQSSIYKLLDPQMVFNYKNKIANQLEKNNYNSSSEAGVYKIPCHDCDNFYVGETGRSIPTRISEHKRDIVMNKPESAIANHVSNFGHRMNFDATAMIFKSSSLNRRHIVESAFICSNKDKALNLNLGFSPHNKLLSKYVNDVILT